MIWTTIARYVAENWLEIAGFVTTVVGIWLTTRRVLICWPVVLAADVIYLIVFYRAQLLSDALLQIFFSCLHPLRLVALVARSSRRRRGAGCSSRGFKHAGRADCGRGGQFRPRRSSEASSCSVAVSGCDPGELQAALSRAGGRRENTQPTGGCGSLSTWFTSANTCTRIFVLPPYFTLSL